MAMLERAVDRSALRPTAIVALLKGMRNLYDLTANRNHVGRESLYIFVLIGRNFCHLQMIILAGNLPNPAKNARLLFHL